MALAAVAEGSDSAPSAAAVQRAGGLSVDSGAVRAAVAEGQQRRLLRLWPLHRPNIAQWRTATDALLLRRPAKTGWSGQAAKTAFGNVSDGGAQWLLEDSRPQLLWLSQRLQMLRSAHSDACKRWMTERTPNACRRLRCCAQLVWHFYHAVEQPALATFMTACAAATLPQQFQDAQTRYVSELTAAFPAELWEQLNDVPDVPQLVSILKAQSEPPRYLIQSLQFNKQ